MDFFVFFFFWLWETQLETPIMCAAGSTFVIKKNDSKKKRNEEIPQVMVMCAFPQNRKVETPSGVSQRCLQAVIFFSPNLVGQRWWFYPGSELQSSQLDVAASGRWPLGRGCFAAAAPSGEVARDLWVPTTNNKQPTTNTQQATINHQWPTTAAATTNKNTNQPTTT